MYRTHIITSPTFEERGALLIELASALSHNENDKIFGGF